MDYTVCLSELKTMPSSLSDSEKYQPDQLVGCLGEDPSSTINSQQQTPGSLALSATGCKAVCNLTRSDYGGVWTQTSTLRGMRDMFLAFKI